MANRIDPGDVLYRCNASRSQCVSLYSVRNAMTADIVRFVLKTFGEMGASAKELDDEARELSENPSYFDKWCRELPEWYPGAAFYAPIHDPCNEM